MRVHYYFTNGFMHLPVNTSLIKIKCKLIRFNAIEKNNDEFDGIIFIWGIIEFVDSIIIVVNVTQLWLDNFYC